MLPLIFQCGKSMCVTTVFPNFDTSRMTAYAYFIAHKWRFLALFFHPIQIAKKQFLDSSIIIPDNNNPIDDFQPELKVYPNPTTGPATIELKGEFTEMFLRDLTGKIIERWVEPNQNTKIDISMYPTGVYFITCPYKEKWLSAKLMVVQ